MGIPKCEKGEKSVKFGEFSSDDEALEFLHLTDPDAQADALCKSDGSSYRAVLKKIDVTKPASSSDDPKTDLIFRILDKQNSILSAQMGLDKDRTELAAALRTRSQLKEPKALKQTPTEKLLASIATAAISFGVVTELFKDGAIAAYLGYLSLRGPSATNLIYDHERYSEMKRLAREGDLCGSLQLPNQPSEYANLWKGLLFPTLMGGALAGGIFALNSVLHDEPRKSSSKGSSGPASAGKIKAYSNDELQKTDLSRLREIDADLTVRLSAISEEREKLLGEAREVYRDIYALYMGELKTRDLKSIGDEELRAKAEEILAKGGGEPDASFFEKLGILEYVGIGVGFGIGTGVLHRLYSNVAPWRDFVDRRMNGISKRARNDAATTIEGLKAQGTLKSCNPEPAAAKENVAATEPENPLNYMSLDEFVEGDYLEYFVERGANPVEIQALDWRTDVPGRMVSFFSDFQYYKEPVETTPNMITDRDRWVSILDETPDVLVAKYSKSPEDEAAIRGAVERIATAYKAREGSGEEDVSVNLMKWSLQWYTLNLKDGYVPTADEVDNVMVLTSAGNGVVATYFQIQRLASMKEVSFEDASQEYWGVMGSGDASKVSAPTVTYKGAGAALLDSDVSGASDPLTVTTPTVSFPRIQEPNVSPGTVVMPNSLPAPKVAPRLVPVVP